jgi:hypothetical protein
MESIRDEKQEKAMTPYYDIRYAASEETIGEILYQPQTIDSRKRAKKAFEISQMLQQKVHGAISRTQSPDPYSS